MGLVLTLEGLINTTGDSVLTFRPLTQPLTIGMSVVWKKYLVFSTASAKFQELMKEQFEQI